MWYSWHDDNDHLNWYPRPTDFPFNGSEVSVELNEFASVPHFYADVEDYVAISDSNCFARAQKSRFA